MSQSSRQDANTEPRIEVQSRIALIGRLASSTVLESQGLEKSLQEITEVAVQLLDVDRVSIWLAMEDRRFVKAADGFEAKTGKHTKGEVVDLTVRVSYLDYLSQRHVLAVEDVQTDDRVADIREVMLNPRGIKALIDAKIWRDGEFAGSLVASSYQGPRHWREDDLIVAGVLAEFVTLSLEKNDRQLADQRFRDWAEASSDGFWDMDRDFKFTEIDGDFLRAHGFDPNTLLGKKRWEVPNAETNEHFWDEHIATLEAHQQFVDFRYRIQMPSGIQRTISVSGKPVFDQSGEFLGYRGSIADVTDVVANEKAKRQSEARFRDLIEGSVQGTIITTADGRLLFQNAAFLKMLGRDEDDPFPPGQMSIELVSPKDRELIVELRQSVFAAEPLSTDTFEYKLLRKDGSDASVRSVVRILEWDGEPAAQWTMIDVSAERRAKRALRRSEDRYRSLIDLSPDGILIIDDGIVGFANQAAADIFGAENPTDMVGLDADILCSPRDLATAKERRAGVLSGNLNSVPWESTGLRLDGTPVPIEMMAAPIPGESGLSLQILVRDISAKKRADEELRKVENALRQSQKMEAVGQLTGGVAHDFNNLLAIVLGNAELIVHAVDDPGDPLHSLAQTIERAAARGAELTQHLLAFSRKQALSPKAIDLTNELDGIAHILRRALGETVEIEISMTTDLWPALADSSQLENALLNLALNARDAMPDGGKLKIDARNIDYAEIDRDISIDLALGSYILLSVTDTGSGMGPDMLAHVFEPFYTTKEVGKGTGLGLSMVFGFAKQSNGHVSIESRLGAGTTVKLYLPKAGGKSGRENDAATARPDVQGRQEVVLVLEDEADVRSLVVSLVKMLGYLPLEAANGPEALAILEGDRRIDVLLSDIVLPDGLAGPEVARLAKQLRPGLKVLFMSGYADSETLSQGLKDENTILLKKPFRRAELAQGLKDLLGNDP